MAARAADGGLQTATGKNSQIQPEMSHPVRMPTGMTQRVRQIPQGHAITPNDAAVVFEVAASMMNLSLGTPNMTSFLGVQLL